MNMNRLASFFRESKEPPRWNLASLIGLLLGVGACYIGEQQGGMTGLVIISNTLLVCPLVAGFCALVALALRERWPLLSLGEVILSSSPYLLTITDEFTGGGISHWLHWSWDWYGP
jgi:hypothetical protein